MKIIPAEPMYAIKIPSYTKNYKLNGHLFQIYTVTEIIMHSNGVNTHIIKTDGFVDYNKKQKRIDNQETFTRNIIKNPDINKIDIRPWSGSSPMAYFDKLDDALVYKALANSAAKAVLVDNIEKIKKQVEKQTKKINIANSDIIDKYPEYFL